MDIKIKYMNNISIINIEPNDSIYSLKELISNKFVYPNIDSIRLIYDGNILCDKNKISDSNIFLPFYRCRDNPASLPREHTHTHTRTRTHTFTHRRIRSRQPRYRHIRKRMRQGVAAAVAKRQGIGR